VAIPASSYALGSAELGGWNVLQRARVLCRFGALAQNLSLDRAALSHARYLNSISVASGVSELSHYETITTNPYYTGYYPWDRTNYQHYGVQVAEIIESTSWDYNTLNPPVIPTLEQRGESSMRSLLNTVYHLSGALYDGADVGFGADLVNVDSGTQRHEEYRFGSLNGFKNTARLLKIGAGAVATYPCQNSTDIPSQFAPAFESPNPFPNMTSALQLVGPPIYVKADTGHLLVITSNSVMQGSTSIATTVLNHTNDPNVPTEIASNEAFVVPTLALEPYTIYQVLINGTLDGVPFSRSFSMSTGQ
jgi:hypothetical protein